jgi:hypothetical protein
MFKDACHDGRVALAEGAGLRRGPPGPSSPNPDQSPIADAPKSLSRDFVHQQRGRDSNPRLTFLPATAFKAVPIGHSGTPPGRVRTL